MFLLSTRRLFSQPLVLRLLERQGTNKAGLDLFGLLLRRRRRRPHLWHFIICIWFRCVVGNIAITITQLRIHQCLVVILW